MDFPLLDAMDIARNHARWHPVSRSEALRASAHGPVAVLSRQAGQDAASWLIPANRFFRSDGPFRYDNLRYYVYTGAQFGKLKGRTRPPAREESELEWATAETEDGESISLGSPTAKVPARPGSAKLPDPSLPPFDKGAVLSPLIGIPLAPGLESPKIPGVSGLPEIPGVPGTPLLLEAQAGLSLEFTLVDAAGNPIPNAPFKATMPDGTVVTGMSDADGAIRVPAGGESGPASLEFLDPGVTDPAKLAALAPALAKDKLPIEISLVDAQDKPLAGVPFKLKLPDGSAKEGKSDAQGFIRFPDNELDGDMELLLTGTSAANA